MKKAKSYLFLLFSVILLLVFFRDELRLFFAPDPIKNAVYRHSFHSDPAGFQDHIVSHLGFLTTGPGLQLAPGTSGSVIFSFNKKTHQPCLLRIWLYGDGGTLQPNELKLSTDGGKTFQSIGRNGNYVGAVFDISPYVRDTTHFLLLCEASNRAPYPAVIMDRIEVVVLKGESAQPPLPDLPLILGIVLMICVVFAGMGQEKTDWRRVVSCALVCLILLLAAYLRWNEMMRVAGTVLDGDAQGYLTYAKKMCLFGDAGFYSAQFGVREPFFIFVVKIFFRLFGAADTHLRFVSITFSVIMVFLAYKIGKGWFNVGVGLCAAFILAIHPSLIGLSVRGLRSELFTTLLLLFIYFGQLSPGLAGPLRVMIAGVLMGAILLTRSESLPMLLMIIASYPFLNRSKWSVRMAAVTIIIGVLTFAPHLYATYKKHGDPFYAVNRHTRFYANYEFAGKPGFPTQKEILEKGMYTGPKITPFEYYFKLHSPWQVVKYTVTGFCKIHLAVPLSFASGKGNLRKIRYAFSEVKDRFEWNGLARFCKKLLSVIIHNFLDYFIAGMVLSGFIAGIILLAASRAFQFFLYLIFFQLQTSFIAYLNIDPRLTVHSYPLVALCCGYTVYRCYYHCKKKYKNE